MRAASSRLSAQTPTAERESDAPDAPASDAPAKAASKKVPPSDEDAPASGTRDHRRNSDKPLTMAPPPSLDPPDVAAKRAKLDDELFDLIKISHEEDEDVEPTRVGKARIEKPLILQPPVQRVLLDNDAESDEPTRIEPLFVVSATAQTDPGLRRKRNEDNLLVLDEANLYVVADGMGGHRGGKFASELAVKTIAESHRMKNFEGPAHDAIPREPSELARSIQMANAAILETAKKQPELQGMGTTICAVRFSPKKRRLVVGHVGDSRCYRLRDGVMTQMTTDHTMADFGVAGPESAHLSRAIGIWPTVPIDVLLGVPKVGDIYLLCSDGLTKMLDDDMIATVLRNEEDPKSAVERLIFFANARGGKDNVTVILLKVIKPPSPPPAPSASS